MKHKGFSLLAVLIILVAIFGLSNLISVFAWTPAPVDADYLVRMPGTQPDSLNPINDSAQCGCHNFDDTVEPEFNWQGSMMAQASRDFLFWTTMTVAAQDSIWAVGNPNATDICLRCHFPLGWVNGRSDPTNAADMTGSDYDGVQCTICHYMFDPFFTDTAAGAREGNDWAGYWDEANVIATPSSVKAAETLAADQALAGGILYFNGDPFFTAGQPPATYTESGSGQYFLDTQDRRRGSFADASPNHAALYSRYHKSKYFCGTCHDISNPVLRNLEVYPGGPGPSDTLPSETEPAYSYYHVERTFSEFMLSDYGQQDGAAGVGPFAPAVFETSQPGNNIATCQDCHMQDVTGKGANQGIVRPTDSVEHPNSGQPLHDLTGGSVWVPSILASADSHSTNHDVVNEDLLDSGLHDITVDMTAGMGLVPDALLAGADRSLQMLQMAAAIETVRYSPSSGNLDFEVHNYTGHKLISGFPEGRRMFINIKYYDADGNLLYEINPYDTAAHTLKGLTGYTYFDPDGVLPAPLPLSGDEHYVDELVYEMHGSSIGLTGESETFHFVLSNGRYKDNRLPPKGFRINEAAARLSEPVWEGSSALDYFTAAEYAGGYDYVNMNNDFGITVPGAMTVTVSLNYQTTSREYIEFLRNEINGTGTLTLSGTGAGGDDPYLIQSAQEPSATFFAGLRDWGDVMWGLWTHNASLPGAAPIEMAVGEWDPSSTTAVTLADAQTFGQQTNTLLWALSLVILGGITAVILRQRTKYQS
ncbi:MAG: hypothetical protein H6662_09660 [Ardenticatenaceae bacterium]|nr:hypothetical protein [Ardenticatenaceae bacterium]MCB8991003.1 hypothetical protein [Ardenticatenaceae bacterium]MCB9005317.1 hypothetical protein [Ardenticatenaceae bacterium]